MNPAITDVSAMDKEFDIGYQVGAVVVSIRNSDDLHELWSAIQKGSNIILWCNGLKKVAQSKHPGTLECMDDDGNNRKPQKRVSRRRRRRRRSSSRRKKLMIAMKLLNILLRS